MKHFFSRQDTADHIAVITFNKSDSELNILSTDMLEEFTGIIATLESEKHIAGVVFISGKPNCFIAGMDIKVIESFKTLESMRDGVEMLQGLYQRINKLHVPTVAAIHGICLGGGLELALACTWRVATSADSTKLGLPEIQLGLIPGAGGTQRLPRLIGIQTALDLILSGKRLSGSKALKAGLVDACVPEHLLKNEALKFAAKQRRDAGVLASLKNPGSVDFAKLALEANPIGRRLMRSQAHDMVQKKTKGFYPAAFKALEAVFDGFDLPIEKGLKKEAQLFAECAMTSESKSLIHLFHTTTALKKHAYTNAGKEKFQDRSVEMVGIVGAGFMGAGIAMVCADRGIRARLSDPNKESVGKAMAAAKAFWQKKVERRRLKSFEMGRKLAMISPGLSPVGFNQADVVIEAVFEDAELKRKILAGIEGTMRDDAIFASNTSALPIGEVARDSKRKDRILGMHFFSPVEKMPLLEIVVTKDTAPWAAARAIGLGQDLGKQVIVVNDGPGFFTTRILAFFLAEASNLLMEGVSIEAIDKAFTGFGFPVGPMTLVDEVGIDVGVHVLETMDNAFKGRIKIPTGLKAVLDSGRLGRKNGKGFYTYEGGKKGDVDREIYRMINFKADDKIKLAEIIDRPLLLFINESIRCLEDGILTSPGDGDVGAVFGLGFPPFWGGPFRYVDHIGAKNIRDRMLALADKHGERFKPSAMLQDYARSQKLFFPDEA